MDEEENEDGEDSDGNYDDDEFDWFLNKRLVSFT